MTPSLFNGITYVNVIRNNGGIYWPDLSGYSYEQLAKKVGIRPMVSLKPGVFLADGDGTSTNPYVIEME